MKILLSLCRPLFPQDTGGRIRTFNVFSRLARKVEVHAVSLVDRARESASITQMRKVFRSYTPVLWDEPQKLSAGFYWGIARSRFSAFPYFLEKYRIRDFRDAASKISRDGNFDILVCDGLPAAAAMIEVPAKHRVIFERNVEFMIRKRHWESEKNPLKKRLLRSEYKRAFLVERQICSSAAAVAAVSEFDRNTFANEFDVTNVESIPTGVDADYFSPQDAPLLKGNIVFVGSMDWYPNEEGIFWFVQEIFPSILSGCSAANLTVVGRNPSERLKSLAAQNSRIEITGSVEDVRPYLNRAELVIIPLRIGSGTRIKIFEAMAAGKAVLSTTVGAEGLLVHPSKDILIEDEAGRFAVTAAGMLNDRVGRGTIERAARSEVVRSHSWDRAAEKLYDILNYVATSGQFDRNSFLRRAAVTDSDREIEPNSLWTA
jgi:polysaccharide biosynthesis protein PslH